MKILLFQTNCVGIDGILECTCRPTFSGAFGNTFYVPPNSIEFSSVFLRFDIQNQSVVLGTVIATHVVFVFLLIWARWQDNKDFFKVNIFCHMQSKGQLKNITGFDFEREGECLLFSALCTILQLFHGANKLHWMR